MKAKRKSLTKTETNRKSAIDLWGFEVGISMYFPE